MFGSCCALGNSSRCDAYTADSPVVGVIVGDFFHVGDSDTVTVMGSFKRAGSVAVTWTSYTFAGSG